MGDIESRIQLICIHKIGMHYPDTIKDRQSALRERVSAHPAFLAAWVRRLACEPYCRLEARVADSWQPSRRAVQAGEVRFALSWHRADPSR